jgi:hypothetical protein
MATLGLGLGGEGGHKEGEGGALGLGVGGDGRTPLGLTRKRASLGLSLRKRGVRRNLKSSFIYSLRRLLGSLGPVGPRPFASKNCFYGGGVTASVNTLTEAVTIS